MKPKKIFYFTVFSASAFATAQSDNLAPSVNVPTQFGRMSFSADNPDAKEILRHFDTDKSGTISVEERDSIIPIMAELLPKIATNAERTAFVTKFIKYWDPIPTYMSFFMDAGWPIIRADYPPFERLPAPNRPASIEVLVNPNNKRILVANSKKFPPSFTAPKPSLTSSIGTPFQIKKRFDKNRNGVLDEEEVISLLLEMRFKFDMAKSNGARQAIIARYAEALSELEKDEFTVLWGVDSSFKIYKDPLTGLWQADAPPLETIPFGAHPSADFARKLQSKDPSGLALAEFLDMLQRHDPLTRVELIEKNISKYLDANYPQGGSAQWLDRVQKLGYGLANDGSEIKSHDLERIIEYINERHENVFVPIFFTDPAAAVDFIAKISYENQKDFSKEEEEALQLYYKGRRESR